MKLLIQVELTRQGGKFVEKDTAFEAISELIDGQTLYLGDESEYEVTAVDLYTPPKPKSCPNCKKTRGCKCRPSEKAMAASDDGPPELKKLLKF